MPEPVPGPRSEAVITGLGVTTALGRGGEPLLAAALAGKPAFAEVTRFGTEGRRSRAAATLPGAPALADELAAVLADAAGQARLTAADRVATPFLLALHTDPAAARDPAAPVITGDTAARVAATAGLPAPARTYTTACVAATTAVADAAAAITAGRADRAVVAAGFLVDADCFAQFDAGRTLAPDGQVRPFSSGRRGLLLGDGVAAVVLESAASARARGAAPLARLAGWGRAGDAYHVCQPRPDGTGLARAISAALRRAGAVPAEIGYVNASGSGTSYSDPSEAAALVLALGARGGGIPVSSTKSVHGHALEASGLIELAVTVLAQRAGQLPVNAGYLAPDPDCDLDLVLEPGAAPRSGYALTVNAAFGGANTALLVTAP
jgi:3-oxoacyl-[acyl-carrier-protein] synthase II